MSKAPQYIRTCSIWRALEIVGDKPTLLIMESYWLGTRRFDGFQKQTGLLKTVISDRLQKLIKADCLTKVQYSERPKRFEYRATDKFLDIYPTALCMLHWERKWGASDGKIDVSLIHNGCGAKADPKPVCGACNVDIDPRDMTWEEGPGVGVMQAQYSRRRRQTSTLNETPTVLFDEIAEIIGDRWASLIIRSVFTGLNRFQDIQTDSAIATNILTNRLVELQDIGILVKQEASKGRTRSRYRLTEKGRDIYPILISLMVWGDRWFPSPEGPPLILSHTPCGASLTLKMACATCGENITLGEMSVEITPKPDTDMTLEIAATN